MRVVVAAMPVWSKPLGDLAQSYLSIEELDVDDVDDDFYTRSKGDTVRALTHASLALKRMSKEEFVSCDDAFFLTTRNGPILVLKKLTCDVKTYLRLYLKRVVESAPGRRRKAGFTSFSTLRDSTKLNVTQRVLNKNDYPGFIMKLIAASYQSY